MKGFTLARRSKRSPSWQESHGMRSLMQPVTSYSQSGNRGVDASSAPFVDFIQSMTPTMTGMVPSTEGSPTKVTKAIPQRHAPKLFFQVVLGSVKLRTNTNHGNSTLITPHPNTSLLSHAIARLVPPSLTTHHFKSSKSIVSTYKVENTRYVFLLYHGTT